MKAKKPLYEISLYRTTEGIFPSLFFALENPKGLIKLEIQKPYKTDAGAKREIILLAKRIGLIK